MNSGSVDSKSSPRRLGVPTRAVRVLGPVPIKPKTTPTPTSASPPNNNNNTNNNMETTINTHAGSPVRPESPSTSELSVATVSSNTSEDSNVLSCPICNETMLNRHLDDEHGSTSKHAEESSGKRRTGKAHANANTHTHRRQTSSVSEPSNHTAEAVSRKLLWATPQTEEKVSKEHWQKIKPGSRETCSQEDCNRGLSTRLGGSLNCRKCGRLYCPQHVEYQMKLSPAARHDPENGYWCRVCESCYTKRPSYSDSSGVTTNLYHGFSKLRDEKLKTRNLERNRLEKRLAVLVTELSNLASESGVLNYSKMQKRKTIEHTVAVWEDDTHIDRCPICEHRFSYMLRKHHCRVCGKVICGDLATDCSREVLLSLIAEKLNLHDVVASSTYGVRVCRDCRDLVFAKRNFKQEAVDSKIPNLLKQYQILTRLKSSISQALPKFQESLLSLNDPRKPPSHETMEDAAKIRRKLLQQFGQFDAQARKIAGLSVASTTERYLQKQIYQSATQYLHENMLPLKALPKVLKHSPEQQQTKLSQKEIHELQEQLIVMQEQHFLVQKMIDDAKSTRKFDEVVPLEQSASDLQTEIHALEEKLGDFRV